MPPSCDGKQCFQSDVPSCLTKKNRFSFFECKRHAFFVKRLQGGAPQPSAFHVYLKVDLMLRTVAKKHAFLTLVATPGNSGHLRPIQLEPARLKPAGPRHRAR